MSYQYLPVCRALAAIRSACADAVIRTNAQIAPKRE